VLAYSWSPRDREKSPSLLTPKLMRLRGFSSSTRVRRAQCSGATDRDEGILTPSEAELIESAREDILFRRRFTAVELRREQAVFLIVAGLTVVFPLAGLLALCGVFDQTICWYTHGEMHCFTTPQKKLLRRELLVEVIIYPVLITILAVYYSKGL
jgi:hypothetical protein